MIKPKIQTIHLRMKINKYLKMNLVKASMNKKQFRPKDSILHIIKYSTG